MQVAVCRTADGPVYVVLLDGVRCRFGGGGDGHS
jgi:hypothetical protein